MLKNLIVKGKIETWKENSEKALRASGFIVNHDDLFDSVEASGNEKQITINLSNDATIKEKVHLEITCDSEDTLEIYKNSVFALTKGIPIKQVVYPNSQANGKTNSPSTENEPDELDQYSRRDKKKIEKAEARATRIIDHANINANKIIQEAQNKANYLLQSTEKDIQNKKQECDLLNERINSLKHQVVILEDESLYQDFGLYTPIYDFANSEMYKDRLSYIRQEQKNMIKNETACTYNHNMRLDGSLKKGQKMERDNVKQILRSFNNECETVTAKVKFNNIDSMRNRINKSYESLNKLNASMGVHLLPEYLRSKLDELNLSYEYAVKKQEEKEAAKEERERLREEAKLQKEIEEARKNLQKEKSHYSNALTSIEKQLSTATDDNKVDIEQKKNEILAKLTDIEKAIKDVDYREANKRAGYVYIISNIGSFGQDVYKIGMTRRLEPLDRINELSDASVPFNFDVHAMIFSDDAPTLENELHKAFENKKVNMINPRREFFHVPLKEIEKEVKSHHNKYVEFTVTPEAEQYRETQMMIKKVQS